MFLFRMCTSAVNFLEPPHIEDRSTKVMTRDDTRALPLSADQKLEQFVQHQDTLSKTQEAIRSLDARIQGYELARARYFKLAKDAKNAGNSTAALQWMKMFKKTDLNMKTATENKTKLDLISCEMQAVSDARQDMQAQREAAESLRILMKGLTPESVQRAQEELQNSVSASEDLAQHLGRPLESKLPEMVGEQILMEELEALMADEEQNDPAHTPAAAAAAPPRTMPEIISPVPVASTTRSRVSRTALMAEANQ